MAVLCLQWFVKLIEFQEVIVWFQQCRFLVGEVLQVRIEPIVATSFERVIYASIKRLVHSWNVPGQIVRERIGQRTINTWITQRIDAR